MRKTECLIIWELPKNYRRRKPRIAITPRCLAKPTNKADLTESFVDELYDNVIELRRAVDPSIEEIQQCLYQLRELRTLPMPNQYCRDTIELIEQHLERLQ